MSLQYYTALSHLEWAFKKKLLHEVCFHIVQWQSAAAKSKQKFIEKSDTFLFFAIIYLFDKYTRLHQLSIWFCLNLPLALKLTLERSLKVKKRLIDLYAL